MRRAGRRYLKEIFWKGDSREIFKNNEKRRMSIMHDIIFFSLNSLEVYGGGEKWLIDIANFLVKRGYNVKVITGGRCPKKRVNIDHLKVFFEYEERKDLIIRAFVIRDIIKRVEARSIYILSPTDVFFPLLFSKSKKKIIGNHGLFPNKLKKPRFIISGFLLRTVAKFFKNKFHVHVLNSWQKHFYEKLGFRKIFLLYNPIRTSEYEYPKKSNNFQVVFLGRLNYQKGADILIKMLELAIKSEDFNNKDINFVIMGSGDVNIESKLKSLDKGSKMIKYLGFVDKETKRKILARASLIIAPSRFEGQPISVIEGLVSGVPFLGSNIPPFRDLIEIKSDFGLIVNKLSPKTFLTKILDVYMSWKDFQEDFYQRRARISKFARKIFDISLIGEKFERYFLVS